VSSVYSFFRLERVRGGGLPTALVLSVALCHKPALAPEFGPAAMAHRIRRLRLMDGDPVAIEEIWLDASHAATLNAEDLSESLYLHYRRTLGLVIARVEDRIGIGTVPDWSVPSFSPKTGQTVALVERLSWLACGAPAEYSRTWFDSERVRYVARMGKG